MPKLLYVEDEALVAMSVVITLEDAGFEVVHVVNGAAAIAALKKGIDDYSVCSPMCAFPRSMAG